MEHGRSTGWALAEGGRVFVVDVDQRDGWWVVTAAGEVDVASAPTLRARVVEVVAAGGRRVQLDLTRVDFIDSFGLGVVVGALKRVRAHGGELRVVAGHGAVRDVLELTRLDRALDLVDAVESGPAGVEERAR